MSVVITADIVGSRELDDRAEAQRQIDAAVERVERDAPAATRPLRATVGDELQGVYPDLASALCALTLLRLALPEDVDLRFGVGIGEIGMIPSSAGELSEGPGWWAAREAIDTLHAKQVRAMPRVRTWISAAPDAADAASLALANSYAWARDELISAMSGRARRLSYGRCLGHTQAALARQERITQSAVSQILATAGASAVVEGYRALRENA
ncbi:SatD family protein [Microbacterium sp.]|uniref:SatD family protein n=1 Tax=Microbacterium sp. TaxID=51671 RepID=UPI0037367ED5